MKTFFYTLITLLFFTGCSATWNGVKDDTGNVIDWSKSKVNQGAAYVKEKTD